MYVNYNKTVFWIIIINHPVLNSVFRVQCIRCLKEIFQLLLILSAAVITSLSSDWLSSSTSESITIG